MVHYAFSQFPCFLQHIKNALQELKAASSETIMMIKYNLMEIDILLLLPNKTYTPRKQTVVSFNMKKRASGYSLRL
jgi:hypothetical protein